VKVPASHIRALTLADVVDLPAPEPSRHKTVGIPCACCRTEVFHARVSHTTVPVCDDCRREADLLGSFICRDLRHRGERVVGYPSIVRQRTDPLLDTCTECFRRRHPNRKVTAMRDNPHRDENHQDGTLESFVSGSRLVATWIRTG
jgi:hypothetical protein